MKVEVGDVVGLLGVVGDPHRHDLLFREQLHEVGSQGRVRRGTPAADFKDQIPEDVKHERFNRLVELVDRISAEKK